MSDFTKEDTEIKIKEILQAKLDIPIESIYSESNLSEDLGVDSIDVLEVGYQIEESFGIKLNDFEEMLHIKTLDDFSTFIYTKYQMNNLDNMSNEDSNVD